jgi:hypothetical protein
MPIFKPGQPVLPTSLSVCPRRRVDVSVIQECADSIVTAGILSGTAIDDEIGRGVAAAVSTARSSRVNASVFQGWWSDLIAEETDFWDGHARNVNEAEQYPDPAAGAPMAWLPCHPDGVVFRFAGQPVCQESAAIIESWDSQPSPGSDPVPSFPRAQVVVGRSGESVFLPPHTIIMLSAEIGNAMHVCQLAHYAVIAMNGSLPQW